MSLTQSCVVGVPVYKDSFTKSEELSLRCLKKYLPNYDVRLISPKGLKTTLPYKVIHFDVSYFQNTRTYSKLLLSNHFYEKFLDYDYLLVYQLDAIVLSSSLEHWLSKKYDYIGAPIWNSFTGFLTHPQRQIRIVGNGGFSLRNIKKHLQVLSLAEKQLTTTDQSPETVFIKSVLQNKTTKKWLPAPVTNYPFNEDGFWACEAQKYLPNFHIAPFRDALTFSWERNPQKAWEISEHEIPFGIHAWDKYDKEFIKSILISMLDKKLYDNFIT